MYANHNVPVAEGSSLNDSKSGVVSPNSSPKIPPKVYQNLITQLQAATLELASLKDNFMLLFQKVASHDHRIDALEL